MTDDTVFDVQHLTVTFGKKKNARDAVKDISFTLKQGEILGLVGESGSGKTTTTRVLTRLLLPTSGEVKYKGTDVTRFNAKQREEFRRQVQMVFQNPFDSLNPRLRVGEIIAEGIDNFKLANNKADREKQVIDLLQAVGLPKNAIDRYPHEFSGGQRQRIGIARALAVQPSILCLDEPVSALDVSVQAQIINLLKSLRVKRDLTFLFIAHDLSVVNYISDRILVMFQGRIVESGPTRAVYQNPLHPYTQSLLSAVPTTKLDSSITYEPYQGQRLGLQGDFVEKEPQHWVLENDI
jgi:oligopeptide transport system ATP-binding protein